MTDARSDAGQAPGALRAFEAANVQRFATLQPLTVGPPDRVLDRYRRDRFSVVGRPDERPQGDAGVALDPGLNIGFIRCEPGKGHCSHSHPDVEIFVPMSSRWAIEITGIGTIEADPWDVVTMPGGTFHSATNIGHGPGFMMSVNNGSRTAPYTIARDVLAEIAAYHRQRR